MSDYEPSPDLNIVDLLPDPIVILDTKGTIQWCNDATYQVTQFKKEDLIGQRFTKMTSLRVTDIPRFVKIFASILRGDSIEPFNVPWKREDGSVQESEVHIKRIKTPEGKKAILVVARDITGQEELREAYRRASFGIDNASDLFFWFDEDWKILYANKVSCDTLQYSLEELMSMSIPDIDPDFPENRFHLVKKELRTNKSATFEASLTTKDKRKFPIEASLHRLEFEGQVLNFGYVKDITERKAAEETLRRSEEQNRTIVNVMSDLILIYDKDVRLREYYTADESLLYLPWKKMKGKRLEEFMPSEYTDSHYENVQQVKDTHENLIFEYGLEVSGVHRWFQGTMMLHQDGESIVVAVKEITEKKRAEETLQVSEEKFRLFFEEAPVYCYMVSSEGTIMDVNKTALQVLEYSREEIIGNPLSIIYPADVQQRVNELLSIWKQTGTLKDEEITIRTKSGEDLLVLLSSKAVYDNDGKIIHSLSIQRDITERKQVEAALEKTEKRFRDLFLNATVGLFRTNEAGNVLECNLMGAKLLGYDSPKEVIEDYNLREHYVNRNRRQELLAELSESDEVSNFQAQITRRDETPIWVELSSKAYPEEGFIEAVVIDITQRKETEERLKESEERYRSLVEYIPDVVWTTDMNGNTSYISPKVLDVYGFTQEEIYGGGDSVWFGRIHPDDVEQLKQQYEELFKKGKALNVEYRIQRKDGEWIWLHDRSIGIYENDGVTMATGIFADITQKKEAEERLKQSEQRFRSIIEHTSDIFFNLDEKGHIIYMSPQTKQILGYEQGEMQGSWIDYTSDNPLNDVGVKVAEHTYRTGEKPDRTDIELLHKNGTRRILEVDMSPEMNDEGTVIGIVGVGKHVTKEREAEEFLRSSTQRYRELLENLPAGVGITDFDECLTMVNPEFCKILGYEPNELIGMNVLDTIAPEYHEKVLTQTESRKTGQSSSYEIQVVRKDGALKNVSLSAVPHRNDSGKIIGTIGLLIDISDAKRAEEAILASEKRLRNLIEQLPLGVAIADLSERVELVNQALAEMLWQERSKLVGESLTHYLIPEYVEKVKEETMARKTGAKSTYEVEMIRSDGMKREVRVSAAPNFDASGKVIGSVGIFEDITDEKKNEIIRAQQEQEIDLYGSLLRHDLRNDLGLILSYIEAVQMLMVNPDEEVVSFLNSALASVERMANLLKSFGRPQNVREVDIVDFIRQIADETQEAEKELKIEVEYSQGTQPVSVTAGSLLALVFMNLFRNSAQHAGDAPQIEVIVSRTETGHEIIVSDNGPGVSEEFQERLFARGISSKGEAGGLGLYLSKQIMERTGGNIELLKEKKGATFRLLLPSR